MPLAALIDLAGAPDLPTVFGQSLLDYQVRRLRRVGVTHLVLVAPNANGVSSLPTSAGRGGLTMDIAESGAEAARKIHPSETVLLVDPKVVLTEEALAMMVKDDGALVLTVDNVVPNLSCELIDAENRWSGWARLSGEEVWHVGSRLGDWNLVSTLLRVAVQAGAARIALSSESYRRIEDQTAATAHAAALLAKYEAGTNEDRSGERIARDLARIALKRMIDGRWPALIGNLLVAGSVAAAAAEHTLIAMPALLVGYWIALTGDRLLAAADLAEKGRRRLRHGRTLCAALVLASTAASLWRASGQWGALVLAGIVAIGIAVARVSKRDGYRLDVTTAATLFLSGVICGAPTIGLALAAAAAAVSLALDYGRLRADQERWSTGT